jgi:2,3-dihydroxybenzoate-AMP ligase/mycobactin salicyl-AMP ligase
MGFTLGGVLDRFADVFPKKEAVVDDRERLSGAEVRDRVNRLAVSLIRLGIGKGDCVLLQLPNWSEYVIAYFAMQKIAAIPVILISGYRQLEVSHLGRLTEAKAWIVPDVYRKMDYVSFIDQVKQHNPQLQHIISVRARDSGKPFTASLESLVNHRLSSADLDLLDERRPEATDVAHVLPSGGTTGLPKGIPRTHNDYLSNVEFLHKGSEMNTRDIVLIVVPVGHNLALLNVVGSFLFAYKLILGDSARPADICQLIQTEGVTYMPTVPSLVRRIIDLPDLRNYDLRSLKKISAGGEPSMPDIIREVYQKLDCTYINEFGMSEGLLCRTSLSDGIETICNTVGKPCCPYEDVRILDEKGNPLPSNRDGELAAKGPGIFAGYLKNPEENKKSFTGDGFFRTGDRARIDDQGYLKITGRIKDIIIRGGENISPGQVEGLLCSHPDIADAAVIGMPDKEVGERVCAYVRLAPGVKLSPDEIESFMEEKGASKLLIPERFEFVETLPMTEAGKHDKKALRKDIEQKLGIKGEFPVDKRTKG